MLYLTYAVGILAFIWCFWALYVFTMGIYRVYLKGQLTGLNKVMASPIVVLAYLVDVFANMTLATVIFLDIPEELLVTSRLQRYMAGDKSSWRYKIASYICNSVLDMFDPNGDHC